MKMKQLARPFFIIALVLGLAVGCASTPDESTDADQTTAASAIAAAKSENAQAKKMGAEWRDTGKLLKKAEAAMKAGDEAKAIKLADKARRQAEIAQKQYKAEEQRLRDSGMIGGADDSAAASSTAAAGSDQYEVVRGDNLWNISGKDEVYANPYQWPMIYKANRDKIKDADLIYAGQVFDIERGASTADIDAAVQHAKTRGAWSVGVVEETDEAYLAE